MQPRFISSRRIIITTRHMCKKGLLGRHHKLIVIADSQTRKGCLQLHARGAVSNHERVFSLAENYGANLAPRPINLKKVLFEQKKQSRHVREEKVWVLPFFSRSLAILHKKDNRERRQPEVHINGFTVSST